MATKRKEDPRITALREAAAARPKEEKPEFLPDVPDWAKACPTLNAFFTVAEIDGKPRQLPTLTIWVEPYGIKGVLADRGQKRKMWFTSNSLVELWDALEAALRDPNARWTDETGASHKRRS